METLKLSSSLVSIGDYAFDSSNIIELTIPASVTSIGSMAFAFSQQLTALTYLGTNPSNINHKGDVFIECTKLKTLILPNADTLDAGVWSSFLGGSFTDIRKQ
ncbi:leucine-rich repeat protein [Brachyspira pulli]|uniref:leucine-rich repeat protein n=1 Tax=Brachyspira pulli TaxID=310721 RepID=UPI003003F930